MYTECVLWCGGVRRVLIYVILAVLLSATVLMTALALYVKNILEVDIRGTVNVKSTIRVVDVKLDIDSVEGVKNIDLETIYIPKGRIVVRSELISYKGNITVIMSGTLQLNSQSNSYRILMPCLMSIGEPCIRIAMIIPGYDEPLDIEGGVYSTTLTLSWTASGLGEFHLRLYIEHSEASK